MLKRTDLREYQERLVNEIKSNKELLLAVDMGLGKTISTLTAIEEMPSDDIKKVLIVGPKRVANTTWPDEFANWEHLNSCTFQVITGDEKKRLKQLDNDVKYYIINREMIPWLHKQNKQFDMIVWDESSSLKAAKMKTPKGELSRFGALFEMSRKAKRLLLLTGTPTPNGVEDIFGQIAILDAGKRLGTSKYKFMTEYFNNISRDPNYAIWKPRPNSYNTIMNKVGDLILKMKSDDYIKLPDYIVVDHKIKLDKKLMDMYDKFQLDSVLNFNKDVADGVIADNPAVLIQKLLQFSAGSIYKEDGTYEIIHNEKMLALRDIIESDENQGENFLIFYNFQHEKDALKREFGNDVTFLDKEGKLIKDWNEGKIKMLACHPASAGHGLNLQHGGSIMVWTTLPWSLELYQQANKRLHRSGQSKAVRCIRLLCHNTVDDNVAMSLVNKDKMQEFVFKLMRK